MVASTVIDGEIDFKTPLEAVAVFNKYATQLGLKPSLVPVPEKKEMIRAFEHLASRFLVD